MQFEQNGGGYVRKPQCLCSPERCGSVTFGGEETSGRTAQTSKKQLFYSQLCISENLGLMAAEEK